MARVLLVDDEPNIRWTMSEFLKRQGHEALSASDYEGAVGILDTESVDVAVVDVILPGRSGIDLLKEISERTNYIPVLVITGEPSIGQMPEILRAGAYDFMPKPVVKDTLISAVTRAFERKVLVDQKRGLEERVRVYTGRLEALVGERTRELAEAHDFLNAVLESSTEYAIVATEADGKISLFNKGAERLFGYEAEDAVGFEVNLLFADAQAGASLLREDLKGIEKKRAFRGQFRFRRSERSEFMGELAVTAIRSTDRNSAGYLYVIKDLTAELAKQKEISEIQARLATTERIAVLGRAAAQIAHEVKNPLSGLRLYALHLKSKISGAEPSQAALVEKIVSTIDHLTQTVERVLDFARPVSPDCAPADLNEVVCEAAQMLEGDMNACGVQFECRPAVGPLSGRFDKTLIRSAVVNLIANSIQAMPKGGAIKIETGSRDRSLWIEVADTGCGMPAEQVRNIFEPFFSTKPRGLGLGLSHARKVIEEHRGTIEVQSAEGEGTRVRVFLPKEGG